MQGNFSSSWLREDLVETEERRKKVKERVREKEEKGKRDEERKNWEKEENETVSAERRCVGFVSAEAF